MAENKTFYIKFRENGAVPVYTHFPPSSYVGPNPLETVGQLIFCATQEPCRGLIGLPKDFGPLTLHYFIDVDYKNTKYPTTFQNVSTQPSNNSLSLAFKNATLLSSLENIGLDEDYPLVVIAKSNLFY